MCKALAIAALSFGLLPLEAQTRISAKSQGKNFDLADQEIVRPFTVSSFLPATCAVGEVRFRPDVPNGQNIYACVGGNTWAAQGTTSTIDPGLRVTRISGTELRLGSDCVAPIPCRIRVGPVVYTISAPARLTLNNGTGSVLIYVTSNGQLSVAATPSATLSMECQGCTLSPAASTFPVDSIPVWIWTATTNQWDAVGQDMRAILSAGRRFLAGTNITVSESGSGVTISSSNFLPGGALVNGSSLRLGGATPATASESLLGLGSALVGGSSSGTVLGINAPLGFAGDLAHWMSEGVSRFRWGANGTFAAASSGDTVTWWGNDAAAAGSSFRLAIRGTTSLDRWMMGAGTSRNFLQANGLGKLGLGTTAPEPGTADLLVSDATPTTGTTQVVIQAGAGQDRDLLQFRNPAGIATSRVTAEGALVVLPEGARPACDMSLRGEFWFTASAAGVADKLEVCAKAANNSYAWMALY